MSHSQSGFSFNDSVSSISHCQHDDLTHLSSSSSAFGMIGMSNAAPITFTEDDEESKHASDTEDHNIIHSKKARKSQVGRCLSDCWTEPNDKTHDNHLQKSTLCIHCGIGVNHIKK